MTEAQDVLPQMNCSSRTWLALNWAKNGSFSYTWVPGWCPARRDSACADALQEERRHGDGSQTACHLQRSGTLSVGSGPGYSLQQ
jgi:hypothetical protein